MERTIAEHIEITPGICGGKPRIAGHRIRVQDVVAMYEVHGMSADEIVAGYPQVTLADIHAALAYYFDHREEITADMRADEAFVDELKRSSGPGLLARLRPGGSGADSLSP